MKTILITLGTGFIGSHVIEYLVEKYNVVVLIKGSLADTWRIEPLKAKIQTINVDSLASYEDIFKQHSIDCIIHLAAKYIKGHPTISEIKEMVDKNVIFPTQLLEAAVLNGVKNFVNTGTFFEYQMKEEPLTENAVKIAYNYYALTKTLFYETLSYYAKEMKINVANLKLFSCFGEKDNPKLFDFLIKSLIKGDKIDFSGGKQKWNFTYVKDTAMAFVAAAEKLIEGKIVGIESFNIGYDRAHTIQEIVEHLEKISGKKLQVNWGAKPYIQNEIFYVNCNNSKAKKILGWQPAYNFYTGIERTYKYYLEEVKI